MVKADGLAAGKGVTVAATVAEAEAAVEESQGESMLNEEVSPEEVAEAVLFLAGDDSTFCSGTGLLLDGGQTAAIGEIDAVFAPEHINKAYAMDVPAWMRRMLAQWQEEEIR